MRVGGEGEGGRRGWGGGVKNRGKGSKEEALTLSPSSSLTHPPRQHCLPQEERRDDGVSDEDRIYIWKKKGRFCDGVDERMMQEARKVNRLHPSSASLRQRFPPQPRCQEPAGAASCTVGGATSASSDPRRLLACTLTFVRGRERCILGKMVGWENQQSLIKSTEVGSFRVGV